MLNQLETLLIGYERALDAHDVRDDIRDFRTAFAEYLRGRYGWSMSCGPFSALIENSELAWERFWIELEGFAATVSYAS